MKTSALKYTVLTWVSSLAMLILLLMPFHAFLTIWGASLFGHYTALRLWKEVLLVICGLATLFLVATDHKIRSHTLARRLVWVVLLFIFVNLAWGLVAYRQGTVSSKALGYGLIVDLRFPIFFLITWTVSLRTARLRTNWQWLVLVPATVVVVFGLLQILVLPHDFLKHFGYNAQTIQPFETINHNSHYIRIFSTLRGANPLGAYLLVPISVLTVLIARGRHHWKWFALLAASLVVLFFSFSRSAWIAAAISIAIILALSTSSRRAQRIMLITSACLVLAAGAVAAGLQHNVRYQNLIFHTQTHSAVPTTSDSGHLAAFKQGWSDIIHDPLGRGPGTAGPASIYNGCAPARIAENFFLQIGQETGWIGLGLFLLMNAGVGYLLWLRRENPLSLALFASLIGLCLINFFSHAWADDTLAYVWWGLAGIAIAPVTTTSTVTQISVEPAVPKKSTRKK